MMEGWASGLSSLLLLAPLLSWQASPASTTSSPATAGEAPAATLSTTAGPDSAGGVDERLRLEFSEFVRLPRRETRPLLRLLVLRLLRELLPDEERDRLREESLAESPDEDVPGVKTAMPLDVITPPPPCSRRKGSLRHEMT